MNVQKNPFFLYLNFSHPKLLLTYEDNGDPSHGILLIYMRGAALLRSCLLGVEVELLAPLLPLESSRKHTQTYASVKISYRPSYM